MNKLTRSALVSLAVMAALLLTACSEKPSGSSQETTRFSYNTAYETIATAALATGTYTAAADAYDSGLDTEGSFRSGIWVGKERETEEERYYVFQDDTHGRIIHQQNGQEEPFSCVLTGAEKSFTIGGEGARPVTVIWMDDTHAVIRWGEGQTESLTFLRESSGEPFHFFNNDQLCAMALDHYEQATGIRPEHARTFYNVDGMIAVQLYNNDGALADTLDWYTVDRYTAEGYDALNQTISLTEAPEHPASAQTTAASSQTTAVSAQTTTAPAQTTAAFTQPPTVSQTLPPAPQTETTAQPAEALPEETAAVSDVLFEN